ncbi:hypothetical protein GFL93_09470 [Rhizobium leguminosarum bv. viciae]|uniref:hypothetical protein n=1 Tax=Rhizobium TaxID=379 RepID=UPI00144101BF|nr:hypothetical protein [Rhizobium leguminosarum]NKK06100.1 hypothetical protein [Rhizobium leguminosarum bv. viciae]
MKYMTIFRPNAKPASTNGKWGGKSNPDESGADFTTEYMLKRFAPTYSFTGGYKAVERERIRWWPETREFVVVFQTPVMDTGTLGKWTERYVWAYRKGRMVELKQFGVPTGWRDSRQGWA